MKLPSFVQDPRFLPAYLVLAAVLALGGVGFRRAAERQQAETDTLAGQCELWEAYASQPVKEDGSESFLAERLAPVDVDALVSELEAAGLTISNISESGTESTDDFQRIELTGYGSFAQILSAFDIIGYKEEWNAVDLLSLQRRGNGLTFDMEVAALRRGTYEKEKYRPHRAHGDRKEQSREDYR